MSAAADQPIGSENLAVYALGIVIKIPPTRETNWLPEVCKVCGIGLGRGEGTVALVMTDKGVRNRVWLCGACLCMARERREAYQVLRARCGC